MVKFLIYDAIKSPLQVKNDFVKLLYNNGRNEITYLGQGDIRDGKGIQKLRRELSFFKPNRDFCFIWNGSEIGCDLVKRNVEQFGIKYLYIEMLFQNNIRLMNGPLYNEYRMNINLDNVKLVKNTVIAPINKTKSKKVCYITQISYDSSLHKVKNPTYTIPLLVKKFVDSSYPNADIVVCPHPDNKNDYLLYNLSLLGNYRVSKIPTISESLDSLCVIGFNSTFLYESYLRDIETKALDKNHILNMNNINKDFVYSCLKHCQLDVNNSSLEDLAYKINNL